MKFLESVFLEENKKMVHEIIEQVQYHYPQIHYRPADRNGDRCHGVVSVTLSLIGVKYAILLGLITGLFNIIPYVGYLLGHGDQCD